MCLSGIYISYFVNYFCIFWLIFNLVIIVIVIIIIAILDTVSLSSEFLFFFLLLYSLFFQFSINKGPSGQGYGFSSGHVMNVRVGLWRELSAKKLMLLNCGAGEESWESLGLQGVQPVHHEGGKSWVFIGTTDAEAETPILWPPHAKSWLIGKDPDAGRDWGQEEKGMTEDEMAGWHHRLHGHEFE